MTDETKRVKVRGTGHSMRPALTASFFPWSQTQVDRKHGRWYLKDWHGLFGNPLIAFLDPTQAVADPA